MASSSHQVLCRVFNSSKSTQSELGYQDWRIEEIPPRRQSFSLSSLSKGVALSVWALKNQPKEAL